MLAPPLWLNHELFCVLLTRIGLSTKVLFSGVITPLINPPITVAGFTTDPIVIGWLIAPIGLVVCLPVLVFRLIPAIAKTAPVLGFITTA